MANTSGNAVISRAFDHKTLGRIGMVEMIANVGKVTINGKELPTSSIEYLLLFSLQNLQDAYAGAENADEATARFAKKLDRLIAGTIGVREAGDGASAEVKMIRTVLREQVRKSAKAEAFKALDEAKQIEQLDALYAKQPEAAKRAIDAEVAKRIAAQVERAKQAKALAGAIDLDI